MVDGFHTMLLVFFFEFLMELHQTSVNIRLRLQLSLTAMSWMKFSGTLIFLQNTITPYNKFPESRNCGNTVYSKKFLAS